MLAAIDRRARIYAGAVKEGDHGPRAGPVDDIPIYERISLGKETQGEVLANATLTIVPERTSHLYTMNLSEKTTGINKGRIVPERATAMTQRIVRSKRCVRRSKA